MQLNIMVESLILWTILKTHALSNKIIQKYKPLLQNYNLRLINLPTIHQGIREEFLKKSKHIYLGVLKLRLVSYDRPTSHLPLSC